MHKIKMMLFALLLLVYPAVAGAQKSEEKKDADKNTKQVQNDVIKKEDELARVSILPFEDRTNSKNFQYMSESLSDAINSSMIKDFSYNRIEPGEVKKSIYEMQQEILKNKIDSQVKPAKKKPVRLEKKKEEIKKETKADGMVDTTDAKAVKKEKTEEQLQQDEEQLILVKKVAKNIKSDIVIYGNYSYDNDTNELVFTVSLYLGLSDAVKELDETRNVVDNTIFTATNKVAKNLVTEIHVMIEEAEKIAAEKRGEKKVDQTEEKEKKKPGEKTALTRKVAMAPTFDWATKKFSLTISPGFYMNNSPFAGCGVCQLQMSLSGRLWIVPKIYVGLILNAGGVNATGVPLFTSVPMWWSFDGLAIVGYDIPVGRWLFSADLGAGYYLILDKARNTAYYNPAFGARVNAEYLLTEIISLGASANVHMYYDKPIPLLFGGLGLSVNFVF